MTASAAGAAAGIEETAPLFDVMGGDAHLLLCSQSYLVKIAPGPLRGDRHEAQAAVQTVALRRIARVTSAEGELHLVSSDGVAELLINPQPFEATAFSSFMSRLNTYLGLAGLTHEGELERRRASPL